jgi:hypothetical protein
MPGLRKSMRDRKIADQHRVARLYRERIDLLQAQLVNEQAEQRAKEYRVAVDEIEKSIAGLAGVATEVEAAIRAAVAAIERFRSAQQTALRSWPANVEFPFTSELGTDRLRGGAKKRP